MSAQLMPMMDDSQQPGTPERPRRGISHVLLGTLSTLMIVMLLGMTTAKLADPSTLPIRQVSVTGNLLHLSSAALEQRASDVVRGGFFNVNVGSIRRALMAEPWVRDVSVKRVWPDRLVLQITEQVPLARWGDDGLINSEGDVFRPAIATFPTDLPHLSGPPGSNRLMLGNLDRLAQVLPDGLGIEALVLSDRRSWLLRLEGGLEIRLGKTTIVERLVRFFSYYPYTRPEQLTEVSYVDLRYTNGFVIRGHDPSHTSQQTGQ